MGGSDRILAVLETGALVGQMALIDRAPRSATVRTRGDSVVLELKRKAFEQLLAARSPVAIRFQEQIAVAGIKQLRLANQRLTSLLQMAVQSQPAKAKQYVPTYQRGQAEGAPKARSPRKSGAPPAGLSGRVRRPAPARPKPPSGPRGGLPRDHNPLDVVAPDRNDDDDMAMMLAYMQTALGEWDMSIGELDGVEVTRPPGQMSAAEERARKG